MSKVVSLPSRKRSTDNDASPELLFARHMAAQDKYASKDAVLHEWTGVYWRPIPQEDLERTAWQWIAAQVPEKATPQRAEAAAQSAILQCPMVPERDTARIVVPARNGYIWMEEEEGIPSLRSPDQGIGLTYCLACDYEEHTEAPDFRAFLSEVLPDPAVRRLVQEYVGYTLIPDTRFQKAQMWLGVGANGKGTLAQIVAALHEKVCAVNLENLHGFALVGLIGASLVYVDETPVRIEEQRLKTLISGDLIQIDRKYRDPLSLRPSAKWVICANQVPAISDQSAGFWRRWHIVPFPVRFSDAEQRPTLARDIIATDLSGVLNWALKGLSRLLARGKFPPLPESVQSAIDTGKRDTNSVMAWVDEVELQVTTNAATPKEAVYQHYQGWCRQNGMVALSSNRFWQRLLQIMDFRAERPRTGGRRRRLVPLGSPLFQIAWED